MKRRLILMRHAKSAWDTEAPSDHERPLNKRGRRDAPRVGRRLAELAWRPELVLCSDSTRTKETWDLMSRAFERLQICFLPSLYGAGIHEVQAALATVPDEIATLMLLGHNPGWEEVLIFLADEQTRLTTANAALLEVEADTWADAAEMRGGWRLDQVVRPKEL